MAIKTPIISVDIDDSDFRRFAVQFANYQAQLKQMPGQWQQIGEAAQAATDAAAGGAEATTDAAEATAGAMAKAATAFEGIVAGSAGAAFQLGRISGASRESAVSAHSQAAAWHNMARDARSFATQIGDATRSLLRWAGLTGLISGILGAGGLLGIDRLAGAAGNARRSGLGLGITPGEQSAFAINYGRVVDPNAFLSGVNDSLTDYTKRGTLYGLGLNERDLAGKDTGQVAQELIPAIKRLVDQYPKEGLEQLLQSYNLGNIGLTKQDLERFKATPADELAGYGRSYQKDAKDLDLNQKQLKAWQDLQVQLSRAGATIEKVFIVGLSDLADPLTKLSAAFTKAVGDLLSAPQLREWIGDLATGIQWLAGYMMGDEFRGKVNAFVKDVGDFGTAIRDAIVAVEGWAGWLGGSQGPYDPKKDPSRPEYYEQGGKPSEGYDPRKDPSRSEYYSAPSSGPSALRRWWYGLNASPDSYEGAHKDAYQQLEGQNGLPSGLLNAVERKESGFKDLLSPAGAQGFFQFMPATAGEYNVNPHDEMSSAAGAAHKFRDMLREYQGDLAKAVAANNWGQVKLNKDIAEHQERWREFLPPETSNYVNSVTSQISHTTNNNGGGQVRVNLNISNSTGANPTISSSQLVN